MYWYRYITSVFIVMNQPSCCTKGDNDYSEEYDLTALGYIYNHQYHTTCIPHTLRPTTNCSYFVYNWLACKVWYFDSTLIVCSLGINLQELDISSRSALLSPRNGCLVHCTYICIIRSINFIHCSDVITGTMASQITSLTVVYSTVYSGTDQRKHQSSASPGFTGYRWIPRTNGQ